MRALIALFIISPLLALIQSIKHYKQAWAKNGLWLFIIFYGFTMVKPEAMDSYRYVLKLKNLYNMPLSWDNFIFHLYSEEGGKVDIYQPIVTYVLSFFTDNGNVLFAVYGLVFGYFYSRNIWLLIDQIKEYKMTNSLWVILFTFACIIGFWELNGVRMWTAAHIFFYGAFLSLVYKEKKGLIIALLSILVHFSFMLPVGLLLLFKFGRAPWRLTYFAYMFSFFIAELNIQAIQNTLLNYAPEFLLPKVDTYLGEEYIESVRGAVKEVNWYIIYYQKSLSWFIAIGITIIYFSKSFKISKALKSLIGFSLLFLTVGNIVSQLPSGGRFLMVAQLFSLAFIFIYMLENKYSKTSRLLTMLTPLLVFYIIVSIRTSFNTITLGTVMTNPIIAIFAELPIPLIDLIK